MTLIRILSFLCMCTAARALLTRHEWNRLFKSDAHQFRSDEAFTEAHESLRRGGDQEPRGRHRPRRGAYILQLRDCDSACHRALASSIGQHQYWMRTADVVQVAATPLKLRELSEGLYGANIVDAFPVHPKLKYETDVTSRISECSGSKEEKIKILVTIVPLSEAELAAFVDTLKALPGELSQDQVHPDQENLVSLVVDCSAAAGVLDTLSELREIVWLEELGQYVTANRWAKGLCQSGSPNRETIFVANITGESQIIGISDTGLDMESCYFSDDTRPPPFDVIDNSHRKVVYYNTYIDNDDDRFTGHGTHVSGSAAGKSTIDYGNFAEFNGNAPDAKIAFFDIGGPDSNINIPSDLDLDLLQPLYDAGARVFTNSWGLLVVDGSGNYFPSRNAYTSHSRSVDKFMLRNPDALVFFSAGNFGDMRDGNTVSAPSTNKNGVCVGASLNHNDAFKSLLGTDAAKSSFNENGVAFFSSEGPTQDNRLKPDVMAPGYPMYSVAAHQDCGVKALQGTSMASPTAAGIAVLVRDYFVSGFYPSGRRKESDGFTPSGALLKAILVHSGTPLVRVVDDSGSTDALVGYPSNTQGYGRIIIGNVLNFGRPAEREYLSLFVRGSARSDDPYYVSFQNLGEAHTYTFKTSPAEEQSPIRVTVTFTDALPASNANAAAVNELSLTVTNLNTSTTYSPLSAGASTSTNVIVVDIAAPAPNSTFSVVVTCLSALSSEQPYAIVMTGEVSTSDTLANSTQSESFSHSSVGISASLMTSIWIMVAACIGLLLSIYTMHRENVIGEKKEMRKRKRHSSMYKGI